MAQFPTEMNTCVYPYIHLRIPRLHSYFDPHLERHPSLAMLRENDPMNTCTGGPGMAKSRKSDDILEEERNRVCMHALMCAHVHA